MKNKKNTFFGKYMRNIIITIIGLFVIAGVVYASVRRVTTRDIGVAKLSCPQNRDGDCFKVDNGTNVTYDTGNDCKTVKNTHSSNKYFVPTKTSTEWNSFKNHKPSGISVENECFLDGENYWHFKPNADHIDICVHGKCRNWYTNDYNLRNVKLLRKYSNYYVPANNSNREVKRGSIDHRDYTRTNGRTYYYHDEESGFKPGYYKSKKTNWTDGDRYYYYIIER